MAIPADTVFECEDTSILGSASDNNGGGFAISQKGATGVDKTLGAPITFTSTLSAVSSNVLTDSAAGFTNAMLGNIINISGQGLYCIQGFTSTMIVTVDRAMGTFSTTTGVVGGPYATPGMLSKAMTVAGNIGYIQNSGADGNTVYQATSATANTSGGVISIAVGIIIQGYSTNRTIGNADNRPVYQMAAATATMSLQAAGAVQNIIFDANAQTSCKFCNGGSYIRCHFKNNNGTTPVNSSGNVFFYSCSSTANSITVFAGSADCCEAYANTASGFINTTTGTSWTDCLSYGNTGASSDGFAATSTACAARNCIAYGNGRDGFHFVSSTTAIVLVNCYGEGNGVTAGKDFNITSNAKVLINCGSLNNLTTLSNAFSNTGFITTTAGAFTNAAGNVFTLNSTANGGPLLKATGDPALFIRGLTANYRDVGAAQHQDPAGGGLAANPLMGYIS